MHQKKNDLKTHHVYIIMENIVIVESPAKSKIIQKYLNASNKLKQYGAFYVTASNGHIRVLDEKKLSIIIDNDNQALIPEYINGKGQEQTIARLKKGCSQSKTIWLATDCDREGEAIAFHIATFFKKELKGKTIHRITFNEITPTAIENAILNPRDIDMHLVKSQECRRMLDRIVGYKLSPELWHAFPNESCTLSAGRVQSATLHLLSKKENDYNAFLSNPTSQWNSTGEFKNIGIANLYKGSEIWSVDTQIQAKIFLKQLFMKFDIKETKEFNTNTYPESPFTTSSLQQTAFAKHGFSPKYTMHMAQTLYEKGYITYMRTDSTYINPDFAQNAIAHVMSTYGQEYTCKNIKEGAKAAHEAIRPTYINNTKKDDAITDDAMKLYKLIWNRTIGYFMSPCIHCNCEIHISDEGFGSDMYYKVLEKRVKHNGFMILYGTKNDSCDFANIKNNLKANVKSPEHVIHVTQTWKDPPTHYNEGTIIRKIDKLGIGRPSTYTSILNKLFEKKYIEITNLKGEEKDVIEMNRKGDDIKQTKTKKVIGKDNKKIVVNELGFKVDDYISKHFDYITDPGFTCNMEKSLDSIASGSSCDKKILWNFWTRLKEDLKHQQPTTSYKTRGDDPKFIINGITYITRKAKYGPVIESKNPKRFINLAPYMTLVKENQNLTNINENDVKLLVSLPKKVDDNVTLNYGSYGFYINNNGKNISISSKKELYNYIK